MSGRSSAALLLGHQSSHTVGADCTLEDDRYRTQPTTPRGPYWAGLDAARILSPIAESRAGTSVCRTPQLPTQSGLGRSGAETSAARLVTLVHGDRNVAFALVRAGRPRATAFVAKRSSGRRARDDSSWANGGALSTTSAATRWPRSTAAWVLVGLALTVAVARLPLRRQPGQHQLRLDYSKTHDTRLGRRRNDSIRPPITSQDGQRLEPTPLPSD